jgi:uncharacterized membrane protein YhhN
MNLVCHDKRRYGFFEQEARGKQVPVGGKFAQGLFWAAVLAGLSYLLALGWIAGLDEETVSRGTQTAIIGWKGAGVWLLALYAWRCAKTTDGGIIAAVMAIGALGDVLIERNLMLGGAAFAVGHVLAIWLYLRNRRAKLAPSQTALAFVAVPATVLSATFLTRDGGMIAYSLILSVMAALAWTSRFSRYRTGIGAMMFVASDLLIFARMTPLGEQAWVTYAVWALYFAGQVLIVLGVTQFLHKDQANRL